jgi:hypothetical protein
MNASIQQQLNNVSTAITALHNAGKTWKAELTRFKPIYDKASPETQVEIRNHVATLVGKLYGVKPILLKTGVLGFERSSAESKALRRLFPVDRVSTSTSSKQVDPIVQRANKLKKDFTKAQLRKLVALLNV